MTSYDGKICPSKLNDGTSEAWLPNLYETSHAANLIELQNGDLLCAWFSGSGEGNPDTNIVCSRLDSGADRWSNPIELSNDPQRSEQNPVLYQSTDSVVWLFHTSNEPHNQRTSRVVCRTSNDAGRTWLPPKNLFDESGIFTRHPNIVLENDDWLLPAYYCSTEGDHSVVKISADHGMSWFEVPIPGSRDRVQMNVVDLDNGSLLASFRSRAADRIYFAHSIDHGRTWSHPAASALPNNNSSVQMIRLKNGHLVIVYNDVTLERDQFRVIEKSGVLQKKPLRTPLSIAVSEDNGESWPFRRYLQTADVEYLANQLGYSYPSIVQTREGDIHVAYTYLRKGIKHVRLSEEWIRHGR
jgi:predicted neuraminidase